MQPSEATTQARLAHAAERAPPRKRYCAPHLVEIARADALLEVLGPAQANYGGGGNP